MRWILKHRPEDFRVSECLTLRLKDSAEGSRFTYLSLTKSGYTTFEAAAEVATAVGLEPVKIGHAGLKDEDGITQQSISVPGRVEQELLSRFNEAHAPRDGRYIRLGLSGWGDQELRAGGLQGNAFDLVVRNISEAELGPVSEYARRPLLMINYYDTQRFGVPGGPQTSHLIGRCLLKDEYEKAFDYIKQSGTPEGAQAQGFQGDAREFIGRLNPKVNAFYRSAAASYDWNTALSKALEAVARSQTRVYSKGCLNV
ncbi:MAG: tRNA pseudouridine(13) synthase TruD, partial [Cystobacter sp.]